MNCKSILQKILSKYIFQAIFDYIEDNTIKMKLVFYSKSIQDKLDLSIFDYQKVYFKNIGFNIYKYFSNFSKDSKSEYKNNDKEILIKKFDEDLLKYKIDINDIKKYALNYFQNVDEEEVVDDYKYIEVYSPFFDIISKTKFLEKKFIIPISTELIDNYKLKNDYITTFKKLNDLNIKYSALIFFYKNGKDIDNLKELNINFSQIKMLDVLQNIKGNNDNDYLCKNLFSLNYIHSNLINLEIKLHGYIDSKSFEGLNSMSSLKSLKLEYLRINDIFILKLNDLELLSLKFCENIAILPQVCLNINELYLVYSCLNESKYLLKSPSLQILEDIESDYFIDYSSLNKLKTLTISIENFIKLENLFLENINIFSDKEVTSKEEIKMIEKLLSIKTLKSIDIDLRRLDDCQIKEIVGENYSVLKLKITWLNWHDDCILYNLQKKFPNIKTLILDFSYLDYEDEVSLKIEENKNSKINDFYLLGSGCKNIKFYFQSYENLKIIGIDLTNKILNIKEILPIFSNECKRTFKSLIYFSFKNYIKYEINFIKNVYNNIQYMPYLNDFIFQCVNENIEEELYKNFIKKLLDLKLRHISFNIINNFINIINKENYSLENLKEISTNINCEYIDNYSIAKFIYN